jgi:hypothetical protein
LAVVGNATVTGNVGFGTTNPGIKGKVEINGVAGNNSLLTPFGVYGKTGGFADTSYFSGNNSSGNISLHASGRILATDFLAFSDERIKRVDGRSDAARDLDTLQKIEVTDYRYIDTVSKGSGKQKKVIAQQVEKVFPQAVSRGIDAVPDIFQKAEIIDGWVQLATDLKKGDRVSLIGEKNEGVHEVLEVELERFRTDFATDGDEVFVYGREVKDFRHVDYEAIAMLNVSATQELARQLELVQSSAARLVELELKAARVEVLERQVADLERMITQLAAAGIDSQTKTPARPQDLPAASVNEVSAPAQAEH